MISTLLVAEIQHIHICLNNIKYHDLDSLRLSFLLTIGLLDIDGGPLKCLICQECSKYKPNNL